MEDVHISGRKCCIAHRGEGGPVIYWGTFLQEDEFGALWDALADAVQDRAFTLAAFAAEDWNCDFSPWPAPAAIGGEDFAGGGRETLSWLLKEYVPFIETKYVSDGRRFLAGYSLAGLFSLWAAYQTDAFAGIACCSGSLWLDGWDVYAARHSIAAPCSIYLSLGGREEKTRNPRMAAVGDRTREQQRLLQEDPHVTAATLEWNSGGHFADSAKRLAKGIRWLLERNRQLRPRVSDDLRI